MSTVISSPRPPASPTPAEIITSPTVQIPDSIDATGRKDVGDELQAFIDSVPDGSRILFPGDATYLSRGALRLDGRSDLTLDGNGATIRLPGCQNDNPGIWIGQHKPSSDIVIRGFTIRGDNHQAGTPSSYDARCQHQHALATSGASRVTIEDVHIDGVYGDCLYVGAGLDQAWSSDITFRDSTCIENGRQGVAIVAGERILVEGVTMDRLAMHVLDIEPNGAQDGARDVVFEDNTIGSYGHSPEFPAFFFGANGSLDAPIERVVVRNNVVNGGSLKTVVGDEFTGFDGQRSRRDIVVTDNRSEVPSEGPVLIFKHADNVVALRNDQPLTAGPLSRFIDSTGVVTQ